MNPRGLSPSPARCLQSCSPALWTHIYAYVLGHLIPFKGAEKGSTCCFGLNAQPFAPGYPFFFFFFSGSLLVLSCGEEEGGLQKAEAVPGVQEVFGVNRNVDRSDCVF